VDQTCAAIQLKRMKILFKTHLNHLPQSEELASRKRSCHGRDRPERGLTESEIDAR